VRTLRELSVVLRHPLLVIDFAAEEATTAASPLGSLAFVGALAVADLEGPAWRESTGLCWRRAASTLRRAAAEPPAAACRRASSNCTSSKVNSWPVQGGVGLVATGIVGIRRYFVRFVGQANHAGTTSMARRRDALAMAAPFAPPQCVRSLSPGDCRHCGAGRRAAGCPRMCILAVCCSM
jgi:hypothetical protein